MAVNWRIFEDPDFLALPEEERRKGFMEVVGSDPEFQGLPKEEQFKGYAEIVRPAAMKPREGGIITEPGHPWLEPMTRRPVSATTAPLELGNIDLLNRPAVRNADGTVSSVRSISFNEDGNEVLVPTVVGGRVVSNEEAIAEYRRTGKHLGKFGSVEEANAAAEAIHQQQADLQKPPEAPLFRKTPRGIESLDITGKRPPLLTREAAIAPITAGELRRREVKAGWAYGREVAGAELWKQGADALKSYGRMVGIQAEPSEILAEAAMVRAVPPAAALGKVAAAPGEVWAGLLPAVEAGVVGVPGRLVLGAFLVNRFMQDYGAGKPMGEVAAGVAMEAATLAPMVVGGALAGRFLGPAVAPAVERWVSRLIGAGPAEGAMAPALARTVASGAERITRATGAALPVYLTAKVQGASDEDALKSAVELGILDLGMGAFHPTMRQSVEQAVKEAGARAWAARAMSPERAQVRVTPERPALPGGFMERVRAARAARAEQPAAPPARPGAPPAPRPAPVEAAAAAAPADRAQADVERLAGFRRVYAPWWLDGGALEAWVGGRVTDEQAAQRAPSWYRSKAVEELGNVSRRAEDAFRNAASAEVPPAGWLPPPPEGPTVEGEAPQGGRGPEAAPGEPGAGAGPLGAERALPPGAGAPGRPGAGAGEPGVLGPAGGVRPETLLPPPGSLAERLLRAGGRGGTPGVEESRSLVAECADRVAKKARAAVPPEAVSVLDPANPPEPFSGDLELAIHLVRQMTGRDPLVVRVDHPEASQAFNGFFMEARSRPSRGIGRHGSRIVLNFDAEAPLRFVAGHEIGHEIQVNAPHLAKPVLDAIAQEVDLERWARETRGTAAGEIPRVEYLGDLLGEMISNERFWHRLADRAPRAFQELAWRVAGILDRLVAMILPEYRAVEYARDLERLRDLVTVMVSDYAELRGVGRERASTPTEVSARMKVLKAQARAEGGSDALRDWAREHLIRLPKVLKRQGELAGVGWQREAGLGKKAGTVVEDYAGILKEYRTSDRKAGGPDEALSNAIAAGLLPEGATTNDLVAILQDPAPRWRTLAIESLKGDQRVGEVDLAMDREQLHEALSAAFERWEGEEAGPEGPPFLRRRGRVGEALPVPPGAVRLTPTEPRFAPAAVERVVVSDRTLKTSAERVDIGHIAPTYAYRGGVWVDLSPSEKQHALILLTGYEVRDGQVYYRGTGLVRKQATGAGGPLFLRRRQESRFLPGMAPPGLEEQRTLFGAEEAQLEPLVKPTVPEAPPAQPRGQQVGLFEGEEREAAREAVEARRRAYGAETGQLSLAGRLGARARGEPVEPGPPGEPGGGPPRAERAGAEGMAPGEAAGETAPPGLGEVQEGLLGRLRARRGLAGGLPMTDSGVEGGGHVQGREGVRDRQAGLLARLGHEGVRVPAVEARGVGGRAGIRPAEPTEGVYLPLDEAARLEAGRAARAAVSETPAARAGALPPIESADPIAELRAVEQRAGGGRPQPPGTQSASRALSEKGGLALVGHTVKDTDQLAALGQILRDPRIETLRMFFVSDRGEILGQAAVTSRMPSSSWVMPRGVTAVRWVERLKGQMRRLGATGYYLLHNHPGGNPLPSRQDRQVTAAYAERLPGLRGHVVIDDLTYGVVEPPQVVGGRASLPDGYAYPLPAGAARMVEAVQAAQGRSVGRDLPDAILTPGELAGYAKQLQHRPGRDLTVVFMNAQGRALWVAEFRAEAALQGEKFENQLLGMARSLGSNHAWGVVARPDPAVEGALVDAMRRGSFRDVWVDGTPSDPNRAYSFAQTGVEQFKGTAWGRSPEGVVGATREVHEPGPEEREGRPFFLRRRRLADEASARLFDEEAVADTMRAQADLRGQVERTREWQREQQAVGGGRRGGVPRELEEPVGGEYPGQMAPEKVHETEGWLRHLGTSVGRVLFRRIPQGEVPHQAPERLLRGHPAGEEFFQRVSKAHAETLYLQSLTTDPILQAYRALTREERRRLLAPPQGEKPFLWLYEDHDAMPSPGLQRLADAWSEVAGRPDGRIPTQAKAVGLEVERPGSEWVRRLGAVEGRIGKPLADEFWARFRPFSEQENPDGLKAAESVWARQHFMDAVAGKGKAPSKALGQLVARWRALGSAGVQLDGADLEVFMNADPKAGQTRLFEGRQTYVPHVLTRDVREAIEARNPDDPIYRTLVHETRTRGIDPDLLQKIVSDPLRVRRDGSLEHERIADLPRTIMVNGREIKVLEDSPAVMIRHLAGAARRIAVARQFGPGSVASYLDEVSRRMRVGGLDPNMADGYITEVAQGLQRHLHLKPAEVEQAIIKPWQRVQGSARPGELFENAPAGRRAWNLLEAFTAASNLSGAVVSNLFGGAYPLIVRMGFKPATKAFAYAFTHAINSSDATRLRVLGYLHRDFLRALRSGDLMQTLPAGEMLEGLPARIGSRVLRTTGFQAINRTIDFATAYATENFEVRDAIERIRSGEGAGATTGERARAAERRQYLVKEIGFSTKDVDRMALEGPNDSDLSRWIGKNIEYVNAVNESPMARPSHQNHPIWRLIVAYSSWIRKMARTSEWAVKEAGAGRLGPLVRLVVGGVASGEAVTAAQNFLKDREREETNFLERMVNDLVAAGTLGLWQNATYPLRHFGEFGHSFFVDVFMPPQAETLGAFVDAVVGVGKGEGWTPVARAARRTAPGVAILEKQFRRYDPDFLAERLSRMVYSGRTVTRGRQREPLQPLPGRENTAKMLMERWHKLGRTDDELLERIRALRARPAEVAGQ